MADTEQRIDLRKKVGIVLEKRKLFNLMCKVAGIFDVSGSTQGLFAKTKEPSTMQKALTRVFAIADKVDDNHTLDAWAFANDVAELPGITPENVDDYADVHIVNSQVKEVKHVLWGGTDFAPFIDATIKFYQLPTATVVAEKAKGLFGMVKSLFKPKAVAAPVQQPTLSEDELPAFIMVFTDGENSDKPSTELRFTDTADANVFYMFVGVGRERFAFLQDMASKFDHVGFIDVQDLDGLSADALYEKIISEKFATWIKTKHPQAIAAAGQQK